MEAGLQGGEEQRYLFKMEPEQTRAELEDQDRPTGGGRAGPTQSRWREGRRAWRENWKSPV